MKKTILVLIAGFLLTGAVACVDEVLIENNGNVGIGTDTPESALDIRKTLSATVNNTNVLTIVSSTTDGSSSNHYGVALELTSNDSNAPGLIKGIDNDLIIADTDHDGLETFLGFDGKISISGTNNSVIHNLQGVQFQLAFDDDTIGESMTVTSANGFRALLMAASDGDGTESIDIVTYNAFISKEGGHSGTFTGTTWTGFRATDLDIPIGGPTTQIGFAVEDLSEGSSNNIGVLVEDGLDGVCFISTSGPCIFSGSGTPESVVSAQIGSLFMRTDGGANTTLYVKESGAGTNTGWVAK